MFPLHIVFLHKHFSSLNASPLKLLSTSISAIGTLPLKLLLPAFQQLECFPAFQQLECFPLEIVFLPAFQQLECFA